MAKLFVVLRVLGVLFVAHGLMLLGADEISMIENGGLRTIRSPDTILTLYRADPKPMLMTLPGGIAQALAGILALPGWGIVFLAGGALAFATRERSSIVNHALGGLILVTRNRMIGPYNILVLRARTFFG